MIEPKAVEVGFQKCSTVVVVLTIDVSPRTVTSFTHHCLTSKLGKRNPQKLLFSER